MEQGRTFNHVREISIEGARLERNKFCSKGARLARANFFKGQGSKVPKMFCRARVSKG